MTSKYISVQHNSKVASQAEQDLQLSKVIVNCIPDAALCLSSDARIIYVNDATCKLVEYSTQELCSMTLQDLEPSLSDRSWAERWQALEQQGFVSYKSRYQTKKGQILPLVISIHYADINGKEVGCVFAKHNSDMGLSRQELANSPTEIVKHLRQEVDELKQKELELETSLSLVHSILESATNGILALSSAGDVLRCNQKFIDMWRVPDATLLSTRCPSTQAFFENQVKDPQALRKSIWDVPSDCETENYDIIELKDGRIFAQYSQPQRLNGEIIGRVWSIWDISEFKWTEEAISCNHSGFSTLAETTQTIIFILQDEQIRYVNSAMETVCGYKKVELLGDFDLQNLVKHRRRRSQLLQTSSNLPQYQEMKIVTKSGQERTLACSIGMLDFAGKPAELVMAIDMTEHKNAEVEVHQALEQAKQLGELKQRFVSMLCHQFRTPLNIISFCADSLKRNVHQWTEEKQLTYVSHIQIAATQIDRLLDEVLLFSKLEAAKLSCEPTLVDLEQLCNKIVKQVQLASDRPTKIEFALKGDRTCYLDRKLLRPILNNLLANALKYSPFSDSTVNLEITCQSNEAIFQVKDRGIGIPTSDLQNLFEPFHRGSNVDGIPGTGLGLAMVKTLVDIHGGRISVDSEVNTGTTFTIVLPTLKNPPIEHEPVQTLQSI